jgi:CoA:oxalate CoA-transferase
MLADLGAEVIKIEMPGFGEEARHFAPHVNGESTYYALLNRGKKSVAINMKKPEGVALVRDLARKADVLVENFRPGVMDRLGLAHERLAADNPRLIYASISGFGQTGAYADYPAFDLVIQAMSGLMSVTGERGGRPTAVGESMADVSTGMFAAFGIVAALFDREKTGRGRRLEVAMLDSVFSMLLTSLARRLFTDRPIVIPKPIRSTPFRRLRATSSWLVSQTPYSPASAR